jgi:hypothetical protein
MSDLGDLSSFLKGGSITDLDWLDVDEKSYSELHRLPKQNLEFSPVLESAWRQDDLPIGGNLVPNKEAPRTMLEVGLGLKQGADESARIMRVARTLFMQDSDPVKLVQTLKSKYGHTAVQAVRDDLMALVRERGLLGGYYIEASDFPACAKADKVTVAFVKRFAASARFVKACDNCSGCTHNAGNTCGTFQKQIVVDVPYTEGLANQVEQVQASRGKLVQASSSEPRERIRQALLAPSHRVAGNTETAKPVVDPTRFLRQTQAPKKVHLPMLATEQRRVERAEMEWSPTVEQGKVASTKVIRDKTALEVVKLLRKEMLKGHSEQSLVHALKLSFSLDDLRSTRESWEPLFKEAGLYGTVYSTQDSFDDCNEGADFLARQASTIKGIVAGGKCDGCMHNKMARCMLYGRPLVAKAQELYTPEVLTQTLREHRMAGRIIASVTGTGESLKDTFKGVYRSASARTKVEPLSSHMRAFTGNTGPMVTSGLVKREIVKTATRYLNEGLYGRDLFSALKSRFDTKDIKASVEDLRPVLAEQGLQGIFYVDASVYADYGKGCEEGARLHRSGLVPYVKMASKCDSCVLQTKVGHCSKYNKPLVAEPPYVDKLAQQKEILASGKSTSIPVESLVNTNRHNILAQFEMQAELQFDISPVAPKAEMSVELGSAKVKL